MGSFEYWGVRSKDKGGSLRFVLPILNPNLIVLAYFDLIECFGGGHIFSAQGPYQGQIKVGIP